MSDTHVGPGALVGDLPDIGMDTKLDDGEVFLGEITVDQWEPGKSFNDKPGQPQWHLGVKPLSFEIRGQSGFFHDWFKLSTVKRSKLGLALTALKEVYGEKLPGREQATRVGRGELIGQRAWFIRKEVEFGKNAAGETMKTEIMLPVKAATDDDIEKYGTYTNGTRTSEDEVVPQSSFTSEELAALSGYYDGKTEREAQKGIMKRPDFSAEIKNGVMTGAALQALLQTEQGTVGDDGIYHPLPF